jgi:hypothetical protein
VSPPESSAPQLQAANLEQEKLTGGSFVLRLAEGQLIVPGLKKRTKSKERPTLLWFSLGCTSTTNQDFAGRLATAIPEPESENAQHLCCTFSVMWVNQFSLSLMLLFVVFNLLLQILGEFLGRGSKTTISG